ncbi:hypothetical protein B0H11DRAFT_2221801 [Mycena galericulata]|nr:hypothetical protein B0H11DRAFT_2221801 [Mycena galericulata]
MLIEKRNSQTEAGLIASPTEDPPPYSFKSGSDSPGQSTSRSRRLSVLPPLPIEAQLSSTSLDARPPPTTPGPSFSQIRLDTRYADITGTFFIDPKQPISQFTNKKNKSRKKSIPDAIFRTRSGKIALELATTGDARDVAKASVIVVSKSGKTFLNLLPADESRPRFDLEVKSNSGNVVIFIPKTYAGAIQLHTKAGSLEYLPAMSDLVQVVKSTDKESLVLFGKQTASSTQQSSDFCHVQTRSGKVVVGLRGEDSYVEEPGLWERIGGYLKGDLKGDLKDTKSLH